MAQPLKQRIEKTRDDLKSWGNERLQQIKKRGEDLEQRGNDLRHRAEARLDEGKGKVLQAEAQVLEAAADALAKAGERIGPRAAFVARGEHALREALVALRAGHHATLPVPGFEAMSVAAAKTAIETLDVPALRTLHAYEAKHKNRVTLLREIDRRVVEKTAH
jgi:ElaB/YqjD/DUF883 family membrane-anchored ribosome-binding protein